MKTKLIVLLLLFFGCFIKATSQVSSTYVFSETTGTYISITGGSQLVTTIGGVVSYDTDGNNITLPTGSQFVFNGVTITSVNMTADGCIWLNPNTTTSGNGVTGPIASGAVASGVIAAMGMDLRSTAIASQAYERRWEDNGTEVVFQWQNCARNLQSTVERFSFQIRINKSTKTVRIIYGNMTTIANSTTYQPQVGLRGTTNVDYNTRRLTASVPDALPNWGAPNGTIAATSNANTVRFTSNGTCYPTSGLIFIWSYNAPISNNDSCVNATLITTPYNGSLVSTVGVTTDVPSSTSSCSTQGNNIWYKLVGNDKTLIATTCNNLTNFNTEIRIYTGNCSALNSMVEVDCNDDDIFCTYSTVYSTVTWCAINSVTYYLSIGYFSYIGGTGNFVLTISENGACSALPIDLLYFKVELKTNYVYLQWSTASEKNNDFFTIERSVDGVNWNNISNINGAGNSTNINNYNYDDFDYLPKVINYYRLKQIDYDGKFKYSDIISIDISEKNKPQLIKTVNIIGQEVSHDYDGIIIYIYNDGSIVKKNNIKY